MAGKIYILLFSILIFSCRYRHRENTFSKDKSGFYYKLLAFNTDSVSYQPGRIAWLSATFSTQNDSVFWDSRNNLNDGFYVGVDTLFSENVLKRFVSRCSELDSACLLIPTGSFFQQQFHCNAIPFFSVDDSVVKVNLRVKKLINVNDYAQISANLKEKEETYIESFFGSMAEMEQALDPLGFYWVEKPVSGKAALVKSGDQVTLSYQAYYLNGRFLEKSPDDFEVIYGTPDQLLKGLNYAISRLKVGDNAKIILPSHLAFGKEGSSNGIVPPYTALIYQICIKNIKTDSAL
ncbi:MAG: FKBP-type peptidyl-prolyl cis-trans isomerase [Bacteroidia bacterium]|nr:FKBP-type peptidyl-prolyl cis-trans isomerase [Bacteroidia bacterium]